MSKDRASMFGNDDPPIDVSGFTTKPRGTTKPDTAQVRQLAQESGFVARDPAPSPPPDRPRRGKPRTGRTMQLNLKVSRPYLERFLAVADRLELSQAEAFERAIDAVERSHSHE